MDRADTFDRGGLRLSKSGVVNPVWTVPNGLTLLRILLTPVFFLLIFAENWYFKNLALLVFTVASLTDFYDGRIARRDGTVTGLTAGDDCRLACAPGYSTPKLNSENTFWCGTPNSHTLECSGSANPSDHRVMMR